jgi:hypothetical protein
MSSATPNHICRLYKALYGLNSPLELGTLASVPSYIPLVFFHPRLIIRCFFIISQGLQMFILIYVDDIIVQVLLIRPSQLSFII